MPSAPLSPELMYLVWSAALTLALVIIALVGAMLQVGAPELAGNREDGIGPLRGWVGRAERAHRNMLESLVVFAILVLAAHAVGITTSTTVLGAQLFFWGRLAHAAFYIAGLPGVRTAAWCVSIAGLVLLISQLLR